MSYPPANCDDSKLSAVVVQKVSGLGGVGGVIVIIGAGRRIVSSGWIGRWSEMSAYKPYEDGGVLTTGGEEDKG